MYNKNKIQNNQKKTHLHYAKFTPMPTDFTNLSGLIHWQWGNHTIAPLPAKQHWITWTNNSDESTENWKQPQQNNTPLNRVNILLIILLRSSF